MAAGANEMSELVNNKSLVHYNDAPVEYKSATGWFDKNGRFWGEDEHMARWCSCDVIECSTDGCSNETAVKGSTKCISCSESSAIEKWTSSVKRCQPSDNLYSDKLDLYFNGIESVVEHIVENDLKSETLSSLRLYVCEENFPTEIDMDCHLEEFLPEDFTAEDVLDARALELLAMLNSHLSEHASISHTPSDIGFDVTAYEAMSGLAGVVDMLEVPAEGGRA
ncbi:conserved hypothetical protein [Vibrio chagasii]|nr:conserved hypothetical protein [Vibrio chagasii]